MATQQEIDAEEALIRATLPATKAAYFQGVLKVEFADRRVTYRSKDEMWETIQEMEARLGILTGEITRRLPRQIRFVTTKGLQ